MGRLKAIASIFMELVRLALSNKSFYNMERKTKKLEKRNFENYLTEKYLYVILKQ